MKKCGAIEAVTMSFKMPTGKKLDSMLDKLSAKDIKEIHAQFELDVKKDNQKETDMPNKETMSSIYEAIADMSDHHLKVASSYEELEKILNERNMKMKITDRQMIIDYLISAALVSNMKEIKIDGQKLTRQDQQAVVIDLINRALVLLNENSLIPFLENIDANKNRTDFLMNLAMRSFNFVNNNEEFISPDEEHESHDL